MTETLRGLTNTLADIQFIVRSPEWARFREFAEIKLRNLWLATMQEVDSHKRDLLVAEARVMFDLVYGFESQERGLEQFLTLKKYDEDRKYTEETMAAMKRGQPTPYGR